MDPKQRSQQEVMAEAINLLVLTQYARLLIRLGVQRLRIHRHFLNPANIWE